MSAIQFKVGDSAVHLSHGPGVIVSIESKEFIALSLKITDAEAEKKIERALSA